MALIGVSVAVADPVGTRLQEFRIALGDQDACGIPTHITLAPPTEVGEDELAGVVEHLAQVAREHEAFTIHLRGTGTFRPVSPVVFVSLVEGTAECELLAKSVQTGPLDRDLDFPYHPHVTVAHELSEPQLDRALAELRDFDERLSIDGFWLYTYDESPGWVPRQRFSLDGRAADRAQ